MPAPQAGQLLWPWLMRRVSPRVHHRWDWSPIILFVCIKATSIKLLEDDKTTGQNHALSRPTLVFQAVSLLKESSLVKGSSFLHLGEPGQERLRGRVNRSKELQGPYQQRHGTPIRSVKVSEEKDSAGWDCISIYRRDVFAEPFASSCASNKNRLWSTPDGVHMLEQKICIQVIL
ncbi:hypothetical protein CPSG_07405 [Coccidioides posadasii str. Silveira]|uniref:Uncharacterized protein n=1 Tax=Coccidioides posadasii (strain RMSCC 757 / Silveira) TaxID=443226 RepID=E9DC53_COCPS|nr:hypothetical protein CPSG_07405 [Coccidioides posadasii str. Silveira]